METKEELKLKITAAYDDYLGQNRGPGHEYDIEPPSPRQVQDDPRTHAYAANLWAAFNAEQDRAERRVLRAARRQSAGLREGKGGRQC